MTGHQIINRALTLLGYTDTEGNLRVSDRIKKRATELLNEVYSEVFYTVNEGEFVPLGSLLEAVNLSDSAISALTAGVAAFMAQAESDLSAAAWWTNIYNSRRLRLTSVTSKKDVLPDLPRGWKK